MSDEFQALRLQRDGAVLSVVLSRPEVHDAFDDASVAELTRAFREAASKEGVRVVVLRSTGRSFCAGADLNWMRRMADNSPDENRDDARRLEDMFRAIATCPLPVVARVQGAALGGGAGLVAAADVVVAAPRARLGFTEVRLGIVPAIISPYVLRKLAPGRAQSLFLLGDRLSADEAREFGLVDRVVDDDDLDAAVDAVIASLLAGSTDAHARVKRLVRDIEGRSLDEASAATVEAIADARASEDGREGMSAFLDRRPPRWSPDAEGGS